MTIAYNPTSRLKLTFYLRPATFIVYFDAER